MTPNLVQRLGRGLGCTEGQAWTVLLCGALGILLAGTGLPGTLRDATVFTPDPFAAAPLVEATQPPAATVPDVAEPVPFVEAPDLPAAAPAPLLAPPLRAAPPPVPDEPSAGEPRELPLPVAVLLDAGWGYAVTGTPVDDVERAFVPVGSLPVTARAGAVNKVSFLRLSQPGATLRLLPVQDPGANQLDSAAAVLVCPVVTHGWRGRDGEDLRTAPRYDCTAGTARAGELQADTSWLFDLSAVPLKGGVREFALVPATSAADFQVVFGRPAG